MSTLWKKAYGQRILRALAILGLAASVASCVGGQQLRTAGGKVQDPGGTYTLILFGANYAEDIETVAILDKEGDAYAFEMYAPDFKYRMIQGMSFPDALLQAKGFLSFHSSFHSTGLLSILDADGGTLGFEVRPFYDPLTFGTNDVLDVNYWKRDQRVVVYVRLKHDVERLLNDRRGDRD